MARKPDTVETNTHLSVRFQGWSRSFRVQHSKFAILRLAKLTRRSKLQQAYFGKQLSAP